MNIIDGRSVASAIKTKVAVDVEELKQRGVNPCLAVILVGEDPASQVYVRNKKRACDECGIISKEFILPADSSQEELLKLIDVLNCDASVNGILCQLPLPEGFDEKAVMESISPEKDVDCFHSINVGKVMTGEYSFLPCTPAGVIEMLDYYNIDITGKTCVVVGRSNIVGKPLSLMLLNRNGTVTTAHSKTKDLAEICRTADILCVAVGKPKFITEDMVKEDAVVIDIGINRVDGKLCCDVDFENVSKKASYITPVPGGAGVCTVAMLMQNTVTAAKMQNNL
jgi:methylenetetrahydrofolate dehydrogenase (NADP+)/methenyltetrahydrofolate cyclohydrolase